jgi:type IV secretory pathway VirB2 component (pilin)
MSQFALAAYVRFLAPNVPNPSPEALPGNVSSVFDKLIGMGLTLAAAVAVACLVGAGIMLMFGETGHGSPGAKFVKIFGGLGIALGAGAIVGFVVT